MKEKTLKYLPWVLLLVLLMVTFQTTFGTKDTERTTIRTLTEPLKIDNSLLIKKEERVHPQDNHLEYTQTYRATISGTSIDIPYDPPTATHLGDKVIMESTLDLTEIINKVAEAEINKKKRRVEGGIGLGVHEGHWYVPVSIQRNFNKMESVELEVHLDIGDLGRVSGGELKYKRKLW
jgi:hypothetical protein